jgi:hypothetical protein
MNSSPKMPWEVRAFMWCLRWMTIPWTHFLAATAFAAWTVGAWRSVEFPWALVAAYGAATFFATGVTSVWVRRLVERG